MTVQFVEIAGQKLAALPVGEYDRLVDLAEDRLDAAAAVAAATRREAGEAYLPASLVDRLLDGDSALAVWREHRGLTQAALADRAGCDPATIAALERGATGVAPAVWAALADALGVTPDDIAPAS